MLHKSAMDNRNLICCGHKVSDHLMSEADRAWAAESSVIKLDAKGRWYHSLISDRDRAVRASYWQPDEHQH